MKKKKLKLKESVKLTLAQALLVIAFILAIIKCTLEIAEHHYMALYYGIGCAAFFIVGVALSIISDAKDKSKKRPNRRFKCVESK